MVEHPDCVWRLLVGLPPGAATWLFPNYFGIFVTHAACSQGTDRVIDCVCRYVSVSVLALKGKRQKLVEI